MCMCVCVGGSAVDVAKFSIPFSCLQFSPEQEAMVRELNQISKEVDGIEVKMGGISEEVEGIEKVRRASVLVLVCACFRGDNTAFVELNTL